MLFECFLAFFSPKKAKKHSKSTLWGTPRQAPKVAQKALRGALSGPGPGALLLMAAGIATLRVPFYQKTMLEPELRISAQVV